MLEFFLQAWSPIRLWGNSRTQRLRHSKFKEDEAAYSTATVRFFLLWETVKHVIENLDLEQVWCTIARALGSKVLPNTIQCSFSFVLHSRLSDAAESYANPDASISTAKRAICAKSVGLLKHVPKGLLVCMRPYLQKNNAVGPCEALFHSCLCLVTSM